MKCTLMDNAVFYSDLDDVATAIAEIAEGTVVRTPSGISILLQETIPMNHKFATKAIAKGEYVRKYGQVIGVATREIDIGAHVHIHNVTSSRNGTVS